MYQDPHAADGSARPQQGQRCAACGQLEADPWARFCGVCGGALGTTAAPVAGRVGGHGPSAAPAPFPPPAQYPPQPGAAGAAYPPMQRPGPAPAAPYGGGVPAANVPVEYTIPSIGFGGPARIGAAVGASFMLLPCVLFAFGGVWLIHWSRELLDSWRSATVQVPVPVVSVNLNMNFIDLLRLHAVYDMLVYWDGHLWLAFGLLWLLPWVLWIVAGSLFGMLMALVYNIIGKIGGGMRVTLRPSDPGSGAAAGPWPTQQQPAAWPGPPPR
ncbi:MAG: hypothetical protein IT306_20950 [Chloroflexi bacterium]|nr:hypothetical protein [Chloroflexota bacterium]